MSKSSLAGSVGRCFAAGTLIHTKTGLVPIEQVKAGDWVLSRQELAGEQAYKQVVRTDSDLSGSIGLLSIYTKGENGRVGHLVVTSDHPFFVKDGGEYSTRTATGWVDAGELGIGNELALVDGGSAFVWGFWELRNTETPGVSWFTFDSTSDFGRYVDLRTTEVIVGHEVLEDYYALSAEGGFTRVQVYNLEVEDFNSYYVGAHGVWVHDVGKEQARAGFSRDTKVHLGDGDLCEIEFLVPGQCVLARSELTGEISLKKVLKVLASELNDREGYNVDYRAVGSQSILSGLTVSPNQLFLTKESGWTEACALRPGEILQLLDGATVEVVGLRKLPFTMQIYEIEVEDSHSYFVDELGISVSQDKGLLRHA